MVDQEELRKVIENKMKKLENKWQLFLLHFAGGSSYSYEFFNEFLDKDIEFIPLELPGRGKRMEEVFLEEIDDAVNDYVKQINKKRNKNPYMIYGHSMGATLGFHVVNKMETLNDPPQRLIVTGNAGPGTRDAKKRHLMSDEELKEELRVLGGVPEEVLQNTDLFAFFALILRSDFALLAKEDNYTKDKSIHTPIYAAMGVEERNMDKIMNWEQYTNGNFDYNVFSGDHFFIYEHSKDLVKVFNETKTENTLAYFH